MTDSNPGILVSQSIRSLVDEAPVLVSVSTCGQVAIQLGGEGGAAALAATRRSADRSSVGA